MTMAASYGAQKTVWVAEGQIYTPSAADTVFDVTEPEHYSTHVVGICETKEGAFDLFREWNRRHQQSLQSPEADWADWDQYEFSLTPRIFRRDVLCQGKICFQLVTQTEVLP